MHEAEGQQCPYFTDGKAMPRETKCTGDPGRARTHFGTVILLGEWGGDTFCPPSSQSPSPVFDKGSGCWERGRKAGQSIQMPLNTLANHLADCNQPGDEMD